jgi:ABC-2 type transport system ATP-binding protein
MTSTQVLPAAPPATRTSSDLVIRARGLARTFHAKGGHVHAVRGLDLDVAEGELVAFLGPNGAGKTTSLRMLTTLLAPTAGAATVAGHDIVADPAGVRRRIGYVGQGNGAGHAQRVRDELIDQGRCYGLSRGESRRRSDELIDALELGALADRRVSTLSGGQRRRLDVALGLVHAPGLLFLDEPSTGLDPQSRANLWEHVLRVRAERGMTVFLTTHYLEEADTMAERVMIMDHGRVIADDTASRLKASLGDRIEIDVAGDASAALTGLWERGGGRIGPAAATAQRARGLRELTIDGARLELRVDDGPTLLPDLLRDLDAAGVPARSATVHRPTLDDVFLALTGRSLRESGAAADPAPATTEVTR